MLTTVLLLVSVVPIPKQFQAAPAAECLHKRLETRISAYTISADTFLQALTKAAADLQLPIGVEWIRNAESVKPVNLSWHDTTIHDIIDSLVKAYPGYEVDTAGEVVHAFPRALLTDKRSPLNIRILGFQAQREMVTPVSAKLRRLVQQVMRTAVRRPVGTGEASTMAIGAGGDRPVTLDSQDALVREILDQLVVRGGQAAWIVTYPGDDSVTRAGFLRTLNPYASDSPTPDDEQPIWVLLPPGFQISSEKPVPVRPENPR